MRRSAGSGVDRLRRSPGAGDRDVPSRLGGPYAFSGACSSAVRIGIEDDSVDFTDPRFHGRVELNGAAFSYWRPLADQLVQDAFALCTADNLCRLILVDSNGGRAKPWCRRCSRPTEPVWPIGCRDGMVASGFAQADGRLVGAGSGAFSFDGGSSLSAIRLDRSWLTSAREDWRVDGTLTIAADLLIGMGGRAQASIFEAGPALISDWSVGVTRAAGEGRTRLALPQPPRAESGHGRFTVPSGRREDRTRLYETNPVSLVPPTGNSRSGSPTSARSLEAI